MRLSCIPVSFFSAIGSGEMTIPQWLDFAAEIGLDGIEAGPLLVKPLGPLTVDEFRRLAEERGLAVSNFTGYSDFAHPDAEVREREVSAFLETIAIARDLGAPSIRALTGQQWPGVEPAAGVRMVANCIRRVVEPARLAGLRVNIENHTKAFPWKYFDFAMQGDVFLALMRELEGVDAGVQFDIANPLVAGEETLPLFEQVRQRVGYVHANDVRRPGVFEFVPVGSGIAPIREVVSRLAAQGYQGWVGIEEASRTGPEGFRQAVRFMRDVLREAGAAAPARGE